MERRIQQRHASRVGTQKAGATPNQAEKIGYVSRQQAAGIKASGLMSASMMGGVLSRISVVMVDLCNRKEEQARRRSG